MRHRSIQPEEEAHLRRQAKQLLRKRARGLRGSMSAEALAARSAVIVQRLIELPELREAARVAVFWPMAKRKEIALRPFDEALRARGVRVAYPRLSETPGEMTFRFVADTATMQPRSLPCPEPGDGDPVAEALDAIVVPGLLFDAAGYRVGYGGGYYDRALRRHAEAARVGVAYAFQLAADLPHEPHDEPVQVVVTDERVLRVGR